MKRYTFGFLCDYMSAKGMELQRIKSEKGKYRLGNPLSNNWVYFKNLADLRKHIIIFY